MSFYGQPKNGDSEMNVAMQVIDIYHEEQLAEHFLCNVNKLGQVPVLLTPAGQEGPITDSLEMTLYMASRYPSLIPSQYKEEIENFLTDLHALNYFSLSFPGRPQIAQKLVEAVQRRLDDPSISDRHRKAMEFKKTLFENDKVKGLMPSEIAKNETKVRELLEALHDRVADPQRRIFGENPTALDARLVPFIARMTEIGREKLIPEKLQQYCKWAMNGDDWMKMMNGRKGTMIPVSEM
ncbi:hypothetical protein H2204_013247 [Knufia peltigerae]|uniref:GST N-terminal domain-containing protein n=1 Tax=Knufia peltigerae TaxID=1002370 RepID=A0AA38XQZ7_9EURO|nr:hypothetical protein H2204_013247 [Knufia peltigerae]